jgi:hypothetical protein
LVTEQALFGARLVARPLGVASVKGKRDPVDAWVVAGSPPPR